MCTTVRGFAALDSGRSACAMAALIKSRTAGAFRSVACAIRTWRIHLPSPRSSPPGSGRLRAEVKTEVNPIGMRGGEYARVARTLGEREMVRDGVDLVDELAGIRSLFEDHFSRGQREFLNCFGVRPEELEVLRIRWTQAHRASVSHWRPAISGVLGNLFTSGRWPQASRWLPAGSFLRPFGRQC